MKKFDKNPLTNGAPDMTGSPMSAPLEPTLTPEPEVTPWKDQPNMSPRPQPQQRPTNGKPRVINADQLLDMVDEMATLGQPIPAELQIEVDKIKAQRHAEASAKGATASREAPMMDFTKSTIKTELSLDDIEVLDQATDMQAQRVTLSNMDDLLHEMRALQVFATWHRLPTSSQAVETVEQVHPEAEVLLGRVMAVITEVIRNNGLDGEAVEAECRKRVDVLRHARSQQGR